MWKKIKSLKRLPQCFISISLKSSIIEPGHNRNWALTLFLPWFVRLWIILSLLSFVFVKEGRVADEAWLEKIPKPADGVLFFVDTNKKVYKLNENIAITVFLINLSEKPLAVDRCDYVLEIRRDGKPIKFTLYPPNPPLFKSGAKLIPGGELITKTMFWNQSYWNEEQKKSEKVKAGIYEIYGRFRDNSSSASVYITDQDKLSDKNDMEGLKNESTLDVLLTTDKAVYHSGEAIKIKVTITNNSGASVPVDLTYPYNVIMGEYTILWDEKIIQKYPFVGGGYIDARDISFCFWDKAEGNYEVEWDQSYYEDFEKEYRDLTKLKKALPGKYKIFTNVAGKWVSNIVVVEIKD